MHRLLCWEALIWKCGLKTFALNNCIFVSVCGKTRMDTWAVSCWVPFVFQQEEWCISIAVSDLSCKELFVQGKRRKRYTVLPQSCGMFCGTNELMKVVWGRKTGSIPPWQSYGRNQLLQDAPTGAWRDLDISRAEQICLMSTIPVLDLKVDFK